MKTDLAFYKQLQKQYPKRMSKEQFYKVAHISKATALYLLQSGLVPCKDTGQKTCRYYIKTTDVIGYLQDRIICPEKYVAVPQWYEGRSRKVSPQKAKDCYVLPMTDELQTQMRQYFEVETAELDDLLSAKQLACFLGYETTTICKWCVKKKIKSFCIHGKYLIPKLCLVDYLCSPAANISHRKSQRHMLYLADFCRQMNIMRE